MRRRLVTGGLLGLAVGLTVGCDQGSPTPSPSTARPTPSRVEGTPVGEVVLRWHEANMNKDFSDAGLPVGVVLGTSAEFGAWQKKLSSVMREHQSEELAGADLTDAVLVVVAYGDCMVESSRLLHAGGGRLLHRVTTPDEPVACAWTPRVIEGWRVPLDGLGVDAPAVRLG